MKTLLLSGAAVLSLLGISKTSAALPPDYPFVVATNSAGAAPGNLIGTLGGGGPERSRTYYVILDNTGTNVIYANNTNVLLRFVTPQGFATSSDGLGFRFKDETLQIVDTFQTLGYGMDPHDIKLLPNGHALALGSEGRLVDLSAFGGAVDARVTGSIIQEIDANKQLVFEWHSLDHISPSNTFVNITQQPLDYTHVNAITIDPIDNNLLVSFRHTCEIVKINRRTGQVMWQLGGKANQFTFVNEHQANAPYYTVGQHDVHRLANGNLLYFDNGNLAGGSSFPPPRGYSRAVEYAIDEVNKIATLVWEYRHTPDIVANCEGSVKRMANGNTLIDWGCASGLMGGTIVTEVNPAGQIVFEMTRRTTNGVAPTGMRSNLTKQLWDSPDLVRTTIHEEIQEDRTYDSPEAGVSVTVTGMTNGANTTLIVQRYLDAVRFPRFYVNAPIVLMEHVVLSGSNVVGADLELTLPDTRYVFDTPMIHDPSEVIVYQRSTRGQGVFSPLATTYNPITGKVRVTITQLGEFIFAYPDVPATPHLPTILSPADQSEVNQSQPVTLTWTAQGLVDSFDLQLSTDTGFSYRPVDTNGLGSSSLVVPNLQPDTEYFWRVRTVNEGGTSDWASASFTTVPTKLELTSPVGGEVWQRFQTVVVRWVDNLSENVALDLYKGGVSNRTFSASTSSSGSFTWTVGQFQDIPPGTDYSVRIRSTTDPSLFDSSGLFSIVRPVRITTVPAGLGVTVDGTNYTAPVNFAWEPDSLHLIETESPQLSSDGHGRYLFDSWSGGDDQLHVLMAPIGGLTNTARFTTNYLLGLTVTPPTAATVTANPSGPWYALGEVVSLSAQPDPDYLVYTWQDVDTQASNSAQVTADSYHAVEVKLIPQDGIPAIQPGSIVTLPDGRVQFAFTAGGGLATEATVWGATTLSPPDWQVLVIVPLINGQGVFVDDTASTAATRFYRVTLP